MSLLILLRHGQSTWNLENRFTGEMDVDLSLNGEQEAKYAAELLKDIKIDLAYTSALKRSVHTLDIILQELQRRIEVRNSAALNERNYGDLQGLNKWETEIKYGKEQVFLWRRSYDVSPPNGESLKDTFNRVILFYKSEIEPQLAKNKNVLIVAHGNSLRALMMYLENINPADISTINIATGLPRVYEFTSHVALCDFYNLN